jgi:hypothetical protein
MPQIFGPAANSIARVVLICLIVAPFIVIGMGYGVTRSQLHTHASITRDQPVPFSRPCVVPIGCVMIQSHARLAATPLRPSFSGSCARPCGSERASGIIIDGLG